jgi:hypothetical protein
MKKLLLALILLIVATGALAADNQRMQKRLEVERS